jgi:hypothetical protein
MSVERLARRVVTASYPEELGIFDAAAADWSSRPRRRLRAPVGMGVDLVAITPVLLSVLSYVAMKVADHALDETLSALSDSARRRLEAAFGSGPAPRTPVTDADRDRLTAFLIPPLMREGLSIEEAVAAAARIVDAIYGRP